MLKMFQLNLHDGLPFKFEQKISTRHEEKAIVGYHFFSTTFLSPNICNAPTPFNTAKNKRSQPGIKYFLSNQASLINFQPSQKNSDSVIDTKTISLLQCLQGIAFSFAQTNSEVLGILTIVIALTGKHSKSLS